MHNQPCGLIDDEQIAVLIHDIQHHRFWFEGLALRRWTQFDGEFVASLDLGRRFQHFTALDQHASGLD